MKKGVIELYICLGILLILLCIYYREPLGNFFEGCGEFISTKCAENQERVIRRQIERDLIEEELRAEREAEKFSEEALKDLEKDITDEADNTEEEISGPVYAEGKDELIENIDGTIVFDEKGLRFYTVISYDGTGKPDIKYVEIPNTSEDVEFRPDDTIVYLIKEMDLFTSHSLMYQARPAGEWEQFKRVGISNDGIYEVVDEAGNILYGNGIFFRRAREDMDTTEEITLAGENVQLDVQKISQYYTLPNGCEVTSLAIVLNYLGFDITKEELSDNYLPKAPLGNANFYKEFVGNPRDDDSYGCYAGVIVNTANAYLSAKSSSLRAVNYTGSDFQDLLQKVKEGKPVIVWTAFNMNEEPYYSAEWVVDGEYLPWKANMHCVVLKGYDTETGRVSIANPAGSYESYDMNLFIKRFKQFYSQAVVIEE